METTFDYMSIERPHIESDTSPEKKVLPSDTAPTFGDFIWKDKNNRTYLWIALVGTVLQFIVFKLCYPFADFFSDSYSYIFGAYANLDINIWPIGYSKFLRVFHFITHSDTVLIGFQYFFLELAAGYFFFSWLYFLKPGKNSSHFLFVFLFFNPLFLYISNYVNSDPLFAALSLLWFTELIWILYKPKMHQLITQAILLYACFAVRNNAMYYPIITVLVFLLSNYRRWTKVFCIATSLLLVLSFVNYQRNAALKLIGEKQFSLFTGWQLANNALYMYENIQRDNLIFPSIASKEIDSIAKQFYKNVPPDFKQYLDGYVANYFIRQPEAPLKQFYKLHYRPKDEYNGIISWGKASISFGEYGTYLISNYPLEYFKGFVLVNIKNYFLPPLEKLEVYNLGSNEVWPIAQYWFGYKSNQVKAISPTFQISILLYYPVFFLVLNICYIGCILIMLLKKGIRRTDIFRNKTQLVMFVFWLINFGFSSFVTINVFRYQFVPMILCVSFTCLLLEYLEKKQLTSKFNKELEENTENKIEVFI